MTTTAKGYSEGTWKGLPHFQCGQCAYATAGKFGKRDMQIHVAGHRGLPGVPQPGEPDEEPTAIDFASDNAAEAFLALTESRRKAVALELLDREPSGATGYTVDDVRRAERAVAEAVTTEEEG